MDLAAAEHGFSWIDPPIKEKHRLLGKLVGIAGASAMRLSVCSQRDMLVNGAEDARCVDARRMEDVGGVKLQVKAKGNRADCGCHESRDIGAYDTCPMGCVYCYAVRNPEVARRNLREHDLSSEFLGKHE